MPDIPTGNVTFMFTDIEGSTRLAHNFPGEHKELLKKHDEIIIDTVQQFNGFIFKSVGDAFYVSFANAVEAIYTSVEIQKKIQAEFKKFDMKIRIGLHTGDANWAGGDYTGYLTLSRSQRIMSVSHGGQIILSESVLQAARDKMKKEISFRDLGERRLKDLIRPEHIYQVLEDNIPSVFPPLKTLDARSNNLPFQITNFIGRDNEISDIKKLLQKTRMLTLTGPGGTGKTRLSIEAAAQMTDEFINGIWFVELAQLTDPSYIYKEIASVIKLNPDNSCELVNSLKEKELLLILDNCEHLIDECAKLSESILRTCPKIKILSTSRTLLRVEGERAYKVPVLSIPDLKKSINVQSLTEYDAVKLFIDRALSVNNLFSVSDLNAQALAELCYRLDGIPLAIELAAARTRVIGVEQILEKINDRFKILTAGSRTALPRQQTLKALIDWSYDLLSEKEKLVFTRLSIFSGGFTLEAAEEVCSDHEIEKFEILDLLSNLIEKSLVITSNNNETGRYTMLETIKQYGFDKLTNKNIIQNAHYNYFLKICKEKDYYQGPDQVKWYQIVKNEHENLRAAINCYIEDNPELSLKLINEMCDAWEMNGIISEGFEKYKILFGKHFDYDKRSLAVGLMHGGFLASQCGDYETAEIYLYKSLKIEKTLNDKTSLSNILNNLGNFHFIKEEMDIAKKFHEEALDIGFEINDKMSIGLSMVNIASINSFFGEKEESYRMYSKGLEIFRELDDKLSVARILSHIARLEYEKNNFERSLMYFEESLPILNEFGDHIVKSSSLLNMGNISFTLNKYDETEDLYEECLAISKEFGYTNLYIHSLIKLSKVLLVKKNYQKAKDLLTESIKLCHTDSDKFKLMLCFKGFGEYFLAMKEYKKSAKVYGILEILNKELGLAKAIDRNGSIKENIALLKKEMGEGGFFLSYDLGMTLNQKDAIEFILQNN